MDQKTHIVMIPSPGIAHLIKFLAIARQLVSRHDSTVTLIIPNSGPPPGAQISMIKSLPDEIKAVFLPPVVFEETIKPELKIFLTISKSLESIRGVFDSFSGNRKKVAALVVDYFGTDAFDIAAEFGAPSYVYGFSAISTTLFLSRPGLEKTVSGRLGDITEPLNLPGCIPIYGKDIPGGSREPGTDVYNSVMHNAKRCGLAEGMILDSFEELELETIRALQERKQSIYPIGPLLQNGSTEAGEDRSGCLDWLNRQPVGSVLFVSFGSGGTLSYDQLTELALGLEASGERFLWIVKSPDEKSALGSYFSIESEINPFGFLPEGFLGRTTERGLVITSWAPQLEILGHNSTAGFLTHCGWNSVVDSIVNGIPMIAWPLYADHCINALLITEGLEVALRPKSNKSGLVGREEITKVIKALMRGKEGIEIREKVNGLKEASRKAISENGSSTKAFSQLVLKWKNNS